MVRLRKPIGSGLVVFGVVAFAIGIAFIASQSVSRLEDSLWPLGTVLVVIGALAGATGLLLLFSQDR